jgi:hypothetical protein
MALSALRCECSANSSCASRDLLGRQAHAVGDAQVLVARKHLGAEGRLVATHGHHAHRLDAAGDHHVGFAHADAVGCHLHRREAGRAEAVDGDAAHGVGQAGQQRSHAAHVHALLGLGHRAADDGILDGLGVEVGHLLERTADGGHQQVVRTGVLEVAAARLADRSARGGDDVGVLNLFHVRSPISSEPACRSAACP